MGVPETFKAAVVPEPKAQITVVDRSLAPLEKGEIAIQVTATAINPVDWKMRDYNFFIKEYPAVLGSDAAGKVVAVGPEVSGFSVGDRVFFQGIIGNYDATTFQQYVKMPAALVGKTPSNISDDEAGGATLALIAGVVAFYDKATGHGLPTPWEQGGEQAGKDKAIVILGGSSSVGQYAIQIARLSGFTKIITNSSAAHVEYLKSLGAHIVLDRSKATVADFASAVGDLPLAFVFDAISIEATQILGIQIVQATKTENTAVFGVQAHAGAKVQEASEQEPKTPFRTVFGLGSSPNLRYLSEPLMANLGGEDGYIAKGLFKPNRPLVIPGGLGGLEAALAKNKEGVSGEKVIIRPFDS
jgi:NADPH:quinone reductase-like Zn-dependent oxidoreductase